MSETDKKITLQQAKDWTANWRSTPSTSARAFLIPVQDLQGVLAEMGNPTSGDACVRAYLGIDTATNTEKLIIVGTEKNREGVYEDLLPVSLNTIDAGANGIWDFSEPCPPKCDPNSALN
ncbi:MULTISPECIES: hypothetical protein [Altibacter]|uniref:hypothetical protein n=1 Tax=Altibacter TaxID=1535231 RepID=UPI0005563100|nr:MULTISPECIES: hypothetical protein [Altibacter]MCW9038450.1 hypothetical protein [Altibacter sp.]